MPNRFLAAAFATRIGRSVSKNSVKTRLFDIRCTTGAVGASKNGFLYYYILLYVFYILSATSAPKDKNIEHKTVKRTKYQEKEGTRSGRELFDAK